MTCHQCSVHCWGRRMAVAHGASKWRWAPQTACDAPKGVQASIMNLFLLPSRQNITQNTIRSMILTSRKNTTRTSQKINRSFVKCGSDGCSRWTKTCLWRSYLENREKLNADSNFVVFERVHELALTRESYTAWHFADGVGWEGVLVHHRWLLER